MRSPEAVFRPNGIAIVGASERPGWANWAAVIDENLRSAGVELPVFPVNPRASEVWGRTCYPSLDALPQQVDLALVIVPAPHVPGVLRAGLARGVRAAIVYAAGFGEGPDHAGRELGEELQQIAASGLHIVGPNCMGALSVHERLLLYPSNPVSRVRTLPAGDVGVVFHSGGTFQFWLQTAATRGLGFSYAVTSGSELDLDLADYLNFLIDDERTRIICCLIEGIRRPEAFVAAARRALEAEKPLVCVKIGRSSRGRAAAQSHTGLLAGDDAVFDAVCERYGVVRCHSLDDMVDAALVLRTGRLPAGKRIAMVAYSGGAKGLFLDAADEAGLEFAQLAAATVETIAPLIDAGMEADNPLDAGAAIPYDQPRFAAVATAVANDPAVDAIVIQGQLPSLPDDRQTPTAFASMAAATSKPLFAFSRTAQNVSDAARDFQEQTTIPFVQGIPNATRALRSLLDYGARRRAVPPETAVAPIAESAGDPLAALTDYGLTLPASQVVDDPEAAAEAARAIGFPVALKAIAPELVHKTEFGAVRLGLRDATAVAQAARELRTQLGARGVSSMRFLVQEMVSGLEVVVGARSDPGFGPILVVGLGGVFVELLQDVAIRLLPVDADDVRTMIAQLRGHALFDEFRGRSARDVDAVVTAAVGLGRFYLERQRWIEDLEVNPLMVLARGQGVRAVDVRLITRASVRA